MSLSIELSPLPTQLGEVERRRSGVREGGGIRWTSAQPARTSALGPLPELAALVPTSPRFAWGGDRRGGYVMVLVAMMLFGIFAMAALVIDLGFARLAQRQMQSAADSAALEGLRGNGSIAYADRQDAAYLVIAETIDDEILRGSQPTNQFHVHLQRGATDSDADLYSGDPAIPYRFAFASRLDRELIDKGIMVRGESRAESRPAVRVGPPVGTILGVVPVAYSLSDWGAAPTNAGVITSDISRGLSIGQTIAVDNTLTPPSAPGYCVIYDPTTFRVVGFGLQGSVVPADGVVAERNATASFSAVRDALEMLNSTELDAIISANFSLADAHALEAPVLVRN